MADKNLNNNPDLMDPAESAIAVKRTGKQVARLQQRIKITKWVLLALLLFVIILYLLFIFFQREGSGEDYGDFTVKLDQDSLNLISLSEDIEFKNPSVILKGTSVHNMSHYERSDIPDDIQEKAEGGAHSEPPNYLAYTFYVKNTSTEEILYTYDLDLTDKFNASAEIDSLDAVRIMFIRNGERSVWANPAGEGDTLEEGTFVFTGVEDLMELKDNKIAAGAIDKYTVIIWFDGPDPECIDPIIGSRLKFQMNFEVQNKFKKSFDKDK